MTDPASITVRDLYAKIGAQAVEIDVLRAQLLREPPAEENGAASGRARSELEEREAAERAKRS